MALEQRKRQGILAVNMGLAANIILAALKTSIGIVGRSPALLADGINSTSDVVYGIVVGVFIRLAGKPPDEEHPFGYGKAEDIAAVTQAVLIFTAGGLIIYSAVRRIISGATIELTEAGIGVMLVSIIVSIFLSRHLLKVSRATGSIALEANARNIAADVYSASGVLVGLVVIRFTQLSILDPIIALVVALFVLKAGYEVMRKSFGGLVDVRLPREEEQQVRSSIMEHGCQLAGFHNLRTRKAGYQRYVELHLVMPRNASVEDSHQMCDNLEQDIKSRLPHTSITIHVEPGDVDCTQCSVSCTLRDKAA